MTYEFQTAAQGTVIVSQRGRAVARISNVGGRWMLRDERRLADAAYRGRDVTAVIHDHPRLADAVEAERAAGGGQ